jgi:hypothetical protein
MLGKVLFVSITANAAAISNPIAAPLKKVVTPFLTRDSIFIFRFSINKDISSYAICR